MKAKKIFLVLLVEDGGCVSSIYVFSSFKKAVRVCNYLNEVCGTCQYIVESKTIDFLSFDK